MENKNHDPKGFARGSVRTGNTAEGSNMGFMDLACSLSPTFLSGLLPQLTQAHTFPRPFCALLKQVELSWSLKNEG